MTPRKHGPNPNALAAAGWEALAEISEHQAAYYRALGAIELAKKDDDAARRESRLLLEAMLEVSRKNAATIRGSVRSGSDL